MASSSDGVNKSGRNQVDYVSVVKEHAQNRETEMTRRHKEETTEREKLHQKEIENLKATYEEKIANVRENSKHTLQEKEAEYMKQIEKLQNFAKNKPAEKS